MSKLALRDIAHERILEHLLSPDGHSTLAPQYQKILERWKKADDLLDKYPNLKDSVKLYQAKYPELSDSQVYNDFHNAKKLFNNAKRIDKEWLRRWVVNDIFKLIDAAKNWGPKGFKAWNTAHSNLIKAVGLDQKEEIDIDPEILQQHNFFIVLNVNGKQIKTDLNVFNSMPDATRKQIADALFTRPMTEDAAFELLESGE
jgi:hypothetical protein